MRAFDFILQTSLAAMAVFAAMGAIFMIPPANHFKGARICFWIAAAILIGDTAMFGAQWTQPFWMKAAFSFLIGGGVSVALMGALEYVRTAQQEQTASSEREATPASIPPPPAAPLPYSKIAVLGYFTRAMPAEAGKPVAEYEIVFEIKNIGQIAADQPFWTGQPLLSPADINQGAAQQAIVNTDAAWNQTLPTRGLAEIEPGNTMTTHDNMKISAADYDSVLQGRNRLHVVVILRYADANTPAGRYWVTQFVGSVGKNTQSMQILVNRTFLGP